MCLVYVRKYVQYRYCTAFYIRRSSVVVGSSTTNPPPAPVERVRQSSFLTGTGGTRRQCRSKAETIGRETSGGAAIFMVSLAAVWLMAWRARLASTASSARWLVEDQMLVRAAVVMLRLGFHSALLTMISRHRWSHPSGRWALCT